MEPTQLLLEYVCFRESLATGGQPSTVRVPKVEHFCAKFAFLHIMNTKPKYSIQRV